MRSAGPDLADDPSEQRKDMLAREQEQLGLTHAAEIKGKEQPCRAGGEEGLELPVGDRRLENKDRQIIVDPLRPG